jgi:outer membrane protein TolC
MRVIYIILFLFGTFATAQQSLSLNDCYVLLDKNYPLLKQGDFFDQQTALDLEVLANKRKPTIELLAQASYQSDVTSIPIDIPNIEIEKTNKEQYRASVNVNQLIYDGGLLKATEKAKKNSLNSKKKALEVSVYQLHLKINQLYYSVLLLQEKDALLQQKITMLEAKLKEVKAGIKYGALLPSQDDIIEAEILKINQLIKANSFSKTNLKSTISQLINTDIANHTFGNTAVSISLSDELKRPELDLFNLKKEEITINSKVFDYKNKPKLFGFAQGGIGNPALNMLDNSVQPYYVVGLKLKWQPFDWKSAKKEKEKLLINTEIIENQRAIFELNANIELDQQKSQIQTLKDQIESDKTIIALRKKVLKTVASQLKNGVITSSIYITELTNLNEAEINLSTHNIQLVLAKANYNTILGQ